jgi:hypothetical protein
MKDLVNEFKVRAAYGEAGVQPGAFDRVITLNSGVIGSQGTFNPRTTLQNPALGVEVSKEAEFGIDAAFKGGENFFSSIGVNATLWNRTTEDVIFGIDVAPSTGGASEFNNGITIASNGFDLGINAVVSSSKDFSWLTTLNFGKAVSTIDKISNGNDIIVQSQYILRQGERLGVHFGFNPMSSLDELVDPADANSGTILSATAIASGRYAVVDGNVVDLLTRQVQFRPYQEVIGDATPDFTLSWRNDFTIAKNLTVALQLDWVKGADIYNRTKQWMYRDFVHEDISKAITLPALVDQDAGTAGVQPDGSGNYVVQGTETGAFVSYYQSLYKTNDKNSFFIEDGSFIRLRELSVNYNVGSLIGAKWMKSWNVGFSARNLLTFTSYSGFDPEVSGNGNDNTVRGLDEFTYPNFRTFSITSSIKF